ncbi:MAG: SDR family oxidoreductase [Myxococcales bacterium]|nr:SDR family oxidoreductase [Myxococcales bacterium]
MDRPLEGKVVLVTGAAVRLGRALALGLGRAGASVAVHYHSSHEEAERVAAEIRADGNRAAALGADLTRSEETVTLVARTEAELGPIAGLVNSAAVFHRADLADTAPELLDRLWAINARGPYLLTREVAGRMLAREGGAVVNVLDVGGAISAWRHYSAYCMTKAAMAALTRCLALELAPKVRVNAVAPGTVLPPPGLSDAELSALRRRIPWGRFAAEEEVAHAVCFLLAGPAFITGQILAVDGGRSLDSGPP